MTTDSPLHHPSEIYAPFEHGEIARLRRHVQLVDDLLAASLFNTDETLALTIEAEEGGMMTENIAYPGEESVRSAVTLFRQVYNHAEPSSYNAVLKTLGRHVHDRPSSLQEEAKEQLRELKDLKRDALNRPSIGMTINGWSPSTAEIIGLFFNGKYFHSDHKQAHVLGDHPEAFLLFEFLGAVQRLSGLFNVTREAALFVIDEPTVWAADAA